MRSTGKIAAILAFALVSSSSLAARADHDTKDSGNFDERQTADYSTNTSDGAVITGSFNATDSGNVHDSENTAERSFNSDEQSSFNTTYTGNVESSGNYDASTHVTGSANTADSYNAEYASQSVAIQGSYDVTMTGLVLANPVADSFLEGRVARNDVDLYQAECSGNNEANLSGSALSGFTGINNVAINGGMNSLQQGQVAIAATSVMTP